VTLLAVAAAAAVVAAVLWQVGRSMFEAPVLLRTNFRGEQVPVSAGVLLVAAAIAVEAGLQVAEVLGRTSGPIERQGRLVTLAVVAAFGLLGTFDDLAASGPERGFAGHVRSMAAGRLTTGGLKLAIGGLVGIVAAGEAGATSMVDLVIGALVVALAANLGNLFDRAPGRCTKVALVAAVVLGATASRIDRPALVGVAIVVGAGVGLLWADLREQLMLGDAGSNVLGAALGLGVVLTTARLTQAVVLVVLVALNLASEKVSFSKVIDGVGPLRAVDRLGRRAPPSGP
jgi:UDP-N-acetylmuramyl pentapeptide phosphotransferase/UDP-N-acetylglucosamine-1-phosphate transferase